MTVDRTRDTPLRERPPYLVRPQVGISDGATLAVGVDAELDQAPADEPVDRAVGLGITDGLGSRLYISSANAERTLPISW
jgi:hypothetical protein